MGCAGTTSGSFFPKQLWSPSRSRRFPVGCCQAASSLKKVPALDQRLKLPVGYASLQHPEPTVGMNVLESAFTHGLDNSLDPLRDEVRFLYFIVFDIYDSNPQADARVEIPHDRQLVVPAAREFEHHVIYMQRIQKGNKVAP